MGHPSVDAVFDEMARSALDADVAWTEVDARVWGFARSIPIFYYRTEPGNDSGELARTVERLRRRALALLNDRPESDEFRRTLSRDASRRRERLAFRPWSQDDVDDYRRLLADPELWRLLPEEYPGALDAETATAWITHSNHSPERHQVFAVLCDGDLVGQARLQFDSDPNPDSAEISYWLGHSHRGRGIGSMLVPAFTARSFEDHPALQRVFARVLSGNEGSLRVLARAGYRIEGYAPRAHRKAGAWFGEHTLAAFRIDYVSGKPPRRRAQAPAESSAGAWAGTVGRDRRGAPPIGSDGARPR